MIVDVLKHWRFYYPTNEYWQLAFSYLESLTAEAEPGEMTPLLDNRVMARVMQYDTRSVGEAVLEAHDIYVDVQMSLFRQECIDWFPRSSLTVKTPYAPDKDAIFFERPDSMPVRVVNRPGMFTVLFSQDAHAPQVMAGPQPEQVKKVVVKIKAAVLQ